VLIKAMLGQGNLLVEKVTQGKAFGKKTEEVKEGI